ncbi:hypothetical protein K443DRAFT_615898 [Laccaria amethystina LaAM-08-1]|uniref:Uncharacterized protein n=1 Tax=Laccaria amethystina LaAM-08-1 TaxID=1095629 RepID=A0A0C9WPY9_9AGAR|nr:hypothetical protein K443DRAFT_615898 [Laccaria amethystina LaAM-08-1]
MPPPSDERHRGASCRRVPNCLKGRKQMRYGSRNSLERARDQAFAVRLIPTSDFLIKYASGYQIDMGMHHYELLDYAIILDGLCSNLVDRVHRKQRCHSSWLSHRMLHTVSSFQQVSSISYSPQTPSNGFASCVSCDLPLPRSVLGIAIFFVLIDSVNHWQVEYLGVYTMPLHSRTTR